MSTQIWSKGEIRVAAKGEQVRGEQIRGGHVFFKKKKKKLFMRQTEQVTGWGDNVNGGVKLGLFEF